MKIGIAGTGKMGSAIAKRLIAQGHQLSVWNRNPARTQALLDLGASVAASPRDLAQSNALVISMLTDEAALDQVYLAQNGLLSGDVRQTLFVDMSTVKPAQAQAIGAKVAAAGATYLECPVGGSVGPASEGKLLGFVGGDAAVLEHARPVLEQLCRRVEHVGPLGAGATMKLAINLPLMVYWQTFSEALSLIQPLGLDPKRVVEIFAETSGGPNMLKVRGATIAQALGGNSSAPVSVDVATMRKDVRSMLAQGQLQQFELPLTALALQCLDRAAETGLDAADCTQLPVWWLGQGGRA
ncbi:MAG: NAD(P)-dependent oxidoreductase [Burkholderiaceae bacterium]